MKLFVPLLDNGNGSVMSAFMMDWGEAFAGRQMVSCRAGDSHADRGMNKIANAFVNSDCDIWINIDADIRFRRVDINHLLEHAERGVNLAYGIYPKKQDDCPPCLGTFDVIPQPDPDTGLAEVRRSGRGFMMVTRAVLEAMKEDNGGPALRYHNHEKVEWAFFKSGTVTGPKSALHQNAKDEAGFPIREWISEDWYFCERARALGYPVLVDTRIALGHVGTKEYRFGSDQLVRLDSNITSWKQIHGWFDYEDLYRDIAAELPEGGTFVEVGCWLGRSIAAMHEFLQLKKVSLHVVDTFCGRTENEEHRLHLDAHGGNVEKVFCANMQSLGIRLFVHPKPSEEAAREFENESCDAVFIDGDHSMGAVLLDIQSWWPKVKAGGILAGHDIDEAGVKAAVKLSFAPETIKIVGRCWRVRRESNNGVTVADHAAGLVGGVEN